MSSEEIPKWKYFVPFYGIFVTYKSPENPKGKWWAASIIMTIFALAIIGGGDKNEKSEGNNSTEIQADATELLTVGSTMNTGRFEITLNSFKKAISVNTGNMFAKLEREEGNQYLVINATYKNIDDTGRTLSDEGTVYIDYNGKSYEFDKSESILLDGWGLILDQMNPLTKKTTNLVFKIPSEIKGNVYWDPENGAKQKFLVTEIK